MVQIRNMPDALHRMMKARAALAGMSLSDYLLEEIRKSAARPTKEEILDRLSNLPPIDMGKSSAELIREGREEREREIDRRTSRRR